MKTKILKIKCPECGGKGEYTDRDYDHIITVFGCETCGGGGAEAYGDLKKGTGYVRKKFDVLNEKCQVCNGEGKNTYIETSYGNGFFGKYCKERKFKEECYACGGTGKKLVEIYQNKCMRCNGKGKETYWEKSFFRSSVSYERKKTCSKCSGSGVCEERASFIYEG